MVAGRKERFTLSRSVSEERVFRGIVKHFTTYYLSDEHSDEKLLIVPCNSRLNYLLTGLYFDFDWEAKGPIEVSKEEAEILQTIFGSQKEYKLWRKAFEVLRKKGSVETKKWLLNEVKVLALRKVIRGE